MFSVIPLVNAAKKLSSPSRVQFSSSELFSPFSKSQFLANIETVPEIKPKDSQKKQYAVLVPLIDVAGEPALLFTKRSSFLSSHRGLVSFPGGGMEDADSTLVETALREAWEEVGLDREKVDIWGQMMPVPTRTNTGVGLVTPVVVTVRQELEELTINQEEVQEVFTVKLSRLSDYQCHGYTQFRGRSGWLTEGFSLPVYWGGPHVIWGLTAVITFQFMSALLGDQYNHGIDKQADVRELT